MKPLQKTMLLLVALLSTGAWAADATLISFGSHGCHYDDGSVVPAEEGGCPFMGVI